MRHLYAIYALLTFLLFFLLLLPFIYLFGCLQDFGQKYLWYLLKAWGRIWFFLLGMPVSRVFAQSISKYKSYIFIVNHTTYLDTTFLFRCLPIPALPLAEADFARIPIFGFLYKKMTLLVDRKSLHSRERSVREMKKVLQKGKNILIFPEGGINQTKNTLKPFYDGAFKLAKETDTTILPVVFPDTKYRWQPDSFWNWHPGKCRALFLEAISPAGKSTQELKELAFTRMKEALEKARK